jgi:hypothetical protein
VLLGGKVEGETPAERQAWIEQKAQQISDFALTRKTNQALTAEQRGLVPTLHREGYQGEAGRRYGEIAAIGGVRNFETQNPDELAQVLSRLAHLMPPDVAEQRIRQVLDGNESSEGYRSVHARNPDARFFLTFNVNVGPDGGRTLDFQNGRIG